MTRTWRPWRKGQEEPVEEKSETRLFITSQSEEQADARKLLRQSRGYWSIEVKNHYRRDANHWQEDRHRFRINRNAAFNISLLCGALMAVMEPGPEIQNQIFERCCQSKALAMKLLNSKLPQRD